VSSPPAVDLPGRWTACAPTRPGSPPSELTLGGWTGRRTQPGSDSYCSAPRPADTPLGADPRNAARKYATIRHQYRLKPVAAQFQASQSQPKFAQMGTALANKTAASTDLDEAGRNPAKAPKPRVRRGRGGWSLALCDVDGPASRRPLTAASRLPLAASATQHLLSMTLYLLLPGVRCHYQPRTPCSAPPSALRARTALAALADGGRDKTSHGRVADGDG